MRDKIIGTVCLVLGIVVIVSSGTSFAYFSASANIDGDDISGTIMNLDVDLTLEEKYIAKELVPLEDNLILAAVNNNCKDSYGYDVCSLYKITLTNNGDPEILNAHITSNEGTTYMTENLKAQLINSSLSMSISNPLTLTDKDETNIEDKRYFYVDNTNFYTTKINTTETMYLVIWLTDTHDYQNDDYSKEYYGSIAFESIGGEKISATFNS